MYKRDSRDSASLLVVLNVEGSSPTGHPPKKTPVSQALAGIFLFPYLIF